MGYSPKVEIVPDEMGGFDAYGKHYEVCIATDTVVRFIDSEYDHLRYLDAEKGGLTLEFLGEIALSTLVAFGLPETRQRLKMLECEHEEYLNWQSQYGLGDLDFAVEE